jgi:RNA polymerase primary sigma factor
LVRWRIIFGASRDRTRAPGSAKATRAGARFGGTAAMACAAIETRWSTASCSARRVSSVARGARCVARARKARDGRAEDGSSRDARSEEVDSSDRERAARSLESPSSSERDSARGAFGEYLSSVRATLDAWEETDLSNPELAGVARSRPTRRARAGGSTNGVASFLVEISQTKLLTKEEEILLATNVQQQARVAAARDNIAARLGKDPEAVTQAELANALGAASAADLETLRITANRSKQLLLRHNLRLVVSVAKKFIGRGVAFEDLIQEGIGGLIRGVEGFDPERGFKFSTYAHWWIRQSCSRAVNDQSRTIRLPVHVYDALSKLQKTRSAFELKHGRKPTRAELADFAQMRPDKIDALERARMAVESLDENLNAYMTADVSTSRGGTKGDLMDSNEHVTYDEDPFDTVQDVELAEDISAALATLAPRERNVLADGVRDGCGRGRRFIERAHELRGTSVPGTGSRASAYGRSNQARSPSSGSPCARCRSPSSWTTRMTLWSDDFLRVFLLLAECVMFHFVSRARARFAKETRAPSIFACLAGQKNPTFRELTHRNPRNSRTAVYFFQPRKRNPNRGSSLVSPVRTAGTI